MNNRSVIKKSKKRFDGFGPWGRKRKDKFRDNYRQPQY